MRIHSSLLPLPSQKFPSSIMKKDGMWREHFFASFDSFGPDESEGEMEKKKKMMMIVCSCEVEEGSAGG
jgi:hypothetical protein